MTYSQGDQLERAIRSIVRGNNDSPAGLEAITLALAGGFAGTKNDSVASGLHDIANAIRELADSMKHK